MSIFRKFGRVTGFALSLVLAITSVQFQSLTVKAEDRVDFSFDINYPGVWDEEDWNARSQQYKQYVTVSYYVAEEQIDISELDSIYTAPYNWINDQVNPGDWIYVEAYAAEGYHISECEIGYRMEGEKIKLTPNDDKLFSAWYQIPEYGEFAFRVDVGEGEEERYSDGTEFSFDVFGVGGDMPYSFDDYGTIEYRINDSEIWHKAHQNWIDDFVCQGDSLKLRVRSKDGFDYDREKGITLGLRSYGEEQMDITEQALSEDGYEFIIEEIAEYSFSMAFAYGNEWTGVDKVSIVGAGYINVGSDTTPGFIAKAADDTPDFDVTYEGWVAGDKDRVDINSVYCNLTYGLDYSYVIEICSRGKFYLKMDENSSLYINGTKLTDSPDYSVEAWNDSKGTHIIVTGFVKYSPKINLSACTVTVSKKSYTYTGKAFKPAVTVKTITGMKVDKSFYNVTYSNNKNVGSAIIKITPKTNAAVGSANGKFKINKATQKPTIKAAKKTVAVGKSVKIKVKKAYGKIKYKSNKKGITFSGNKIKVNKKAKTGTYTVTAKVAGDNNHKARKCKFTIKVTK